jgi:hypothetical protein
MRWTTQIDVPWVGWFAWYPVRLDGVDDPAVHWVWWEWIERKTNYVQGYRCTYYRLPDGFVQMREVKD